MDPVTAIGMALSVGGFASSFFGGNDTEKYAKQMNKISKKISVNSEIQNRIRQEAATNDYLASTRQTVRAAQVARAQALAAAVNQGAQFSSGVQGGFGQIAGAAGTSLANLQTDYTANQKMFSLDNKNAALQSQYNKLAAKAGLAASQPSFGSQIFDLGKTLVGNAPQINNSFAGLRATFGI